MIRYCRHSRVTYFLGSGGTAMAMEICAI